MYHLDLEIVPDHENINATKEWALKYELGYSIQPEDRMGMVVRFSSPEKLRLFAMLVGSGYCEVYGKLDWDIVERLLETIVQK